MLWQSVNESCDVCHCSRILPDNFQYSGKCAGATRCCSHHTNCSLPTYDSDMDKENQQFGSPMKHDSDISFYCNSSPGNSRCTSMMCSPSPNKYSTNRRQPMEEFDLNSQDSGYGTSFTDKESKIFHFAEPHGAAPRKSSESPKSRNSSLFQNFSTGSIESMDDDGFIELVDLETIDDNAQMPCNLTSLLSGPIKNKTPLASHRSKVPFRRSMSLKEDRSTRIRTNLFSSPELAESRPIKRTDHPSDVVSPVQTKRYKTNNVLKASNKIPKVQRSCSATEESIMSALQRSSADPDLIGDFSKPFCLPLVSGRHQDLKSISPATLSDLMHGKYDHIIASYKVIDCRYPYEFEGGHIGGAHNFYTKEQIMSELVESKNDTPSVDPDSPKRHILVFHCEFSSERGPNLSRFLRNLDRTRNNDAYPALHYPEIYLLDGGYKSFYEQYSELCEPVAYKPMLHPEHEHDLKHFRAKSKTWNADTRGRPQIRSTFKRLGFP